MADSDSDISTKSGDADNGTKSTPTKKIRGPAARATAAVTGKSNAVNEKESPDAKRGRGRPKGTSKKSPKKKSNIDGAVKLGRGRPKKVTSEASPKKGSGDDTSASAKPRGRPKGATKSVATPAKKSSGKGRGRPRNPV